MTEGERFDQGLAMWEKLTGQTYGDWLASTGDTTGVMKAFGDIVVDSVFAGLWSRPGLDLKTRTMICVVSDVATRCSPELIAFHLRMALRQGWTKKELLEAMLHLYAYVGMPPVREALLAASDVFKEADAKA